MARIKKKKHRFYFAMIAIVALLIFGVYGCSTTFSYINDAFNQMSELVEKIADATPDSVDITKVGNYTEVKAKLNNQPTLFKENGDVNIENAIINQTITLSYDEMGALLNNVVNQKEKDITVTNFEMQNNKMFVVVALDVRNAEEFLEEITAFDIEYIHIVCEANVYLTEEGNIILGANSLYFAGLEKEGEEMAHVANILGDAMQEIKRVSIEQVVEGFQVFLKNQTVSFGEQITFTPKEAV